MLARDSWSALTIVAISVGNGHNRFGKLHETARELCVLRMLSWHGFGSLWRCKMVRKNAGLLQLDHFPTLGAHVAYQKAELSETCQGIGWDAAWHCFSGWSSAIPGLISSHSSPFLCDLLLNCCTALGLLHHLRLTTTTGKQAAARPNSLMLTKCFAIVRQEQHTIVQYSWKAKLSTFCLPRGICEWVWRQTALGTDAFSGLQCWVQNKSSTIGKSAQVRSLVKVRGYRSCPWGSGSGGGAGRHLQRKAAEGCVPREKASCVLHFY